MRNAPIPTFVILSLCLCLSACATTGDGARTTSTTAAAAAAEEGPEAAALRQALSAAVDDPSVRQPLHLFVSCRGERGQRSVEVFGNGVGIWDFRRQFKLSPDQIGELLGALDAADLASFDEVYGGKPKADPRRPDEASESAIQVICRIEFTVASRDKRVVQLGKGKESLELKRLAEELLDLCEGPAQSGVAAGDLVDGLEKIASGELAPVTMRLLVYRKREAAAGDPAGIGYLLRVDGTRATRRPYPVKEGLDTPVELELSAAAVSELAADLAGAGVATLPANLYADDYRDLTLGVLDQKTSVLARPFAGMSEADQAEHGAALDRVYEIVERLQTRVASDGSPAAPAEN